MAIIARLVLEDGILPLTPENRAMLVASLRDIATEYEQSRWKKVVLHYIETPKLKVRPIQGQNCADG